MRDLYDLGEISDRLAIYDTYARYVHAVDAIDHDGLDEVFDPDTVLDYSDTGYVSKTWQEARTDDLFTGRLQEYMFHMNADFIIKFGPDRLTAEVSSHTYNPIGITQPSGNLRTFTVHGGYVDQLVRYPDCWKFKHRVWRKSFYLASNEIVASLAAAMEYEK